MEEMEILSPEAMKMEEIRTGTGMTAEALENVSRLRRETKEILDNGSKKIVIAGPCALGDIETAIDLAEEYHARMSSDNIYPVFRAGIVKPRSNPRSHKGILYDPHMDGSNDVEEGIRRVREFGNALATKGIPFTTELLNPMLIDYYEDMLSMGWLGSRTAHMQDYKLDASDYDFPVGHKNAMDGSVDHAVLGMQAAFNSNVVPRITEDNRRVLKKTKGNPYQILVMRGGKEDGSYVPNYRADSVRHAVREMKKAGVPENIIIDANHGNSGKSHVEQEKVLENHVLPLMFDSDISDYVVGAMVEMNREEGNQSIGRDMNPNVSHTDECSSIDTVCSIVNDYMAETKVYHKAV